MYNINVVCAYGGGNKWEQQNALTEGAELVIATPVTPLIHSILFSAFCSLFFSLYELGDDFALVVSSSFPINPKTCVLTTDR